MSTEDNVTELEATCYRIMKERDHLQRILDIIDIAVPDMIWAKDRDGKYIYVNQQIVNGLLFSGTKDNTIGRDDQELAACAKKSVGDENHTFGEVCADSDTIVLQGQRPMHFVEHGKVNGERLVLDVHKNVFRDHYGNVIGTCGTGRDISWEHEELINIANSSSCATTKQQLLSLVERHRYGGLV